MGKKMFGMGIKWFIETFVLQGETDCENSVQSIKVNQIFLSCAQCEGLTLKRRV